MKRLMSIAAVAALALCVSLSAGAKKMTIVNFDKGEIPDSNNGVNVSLDDNEKFCGKKGGMSMKVEVVAEGSWVAQCPPKKAVWDGFDLVKFNIYNPGKAPMNIGLVIKSKQYMNDYNKRIDFTAMAKPGMNEMEFELTGACSNDGNLYDWKGPIYIWALSAGNVKDVYYMSNFRVETADEGEKDSKTKK